ncbi:hypothetical protein GCM10010406_26970 [Streptomyces thermolineatus]|uniref:SGNH hydrolase-type esterase domain-containing protein n=1 Tax=Streptomyces thermolineatus TaxID=44033 RepID=A0ABP5YYZ5_9ACTN
MKGPAAAALTAVSRDLRLAHHHADVLFTLGCNDTSVRYMAVADPAPPGTLPRPAAAPLMLSGWPPSRAKRRAGVRAPWRKTCAPATTRR